MTKAELGALLDAHDRSAAWLGRQLGITRSVVSRWRAGEEAIPPGRDVQIRDAFLHPKTHGQREDVQPV